MELLLDIEAIGGRNNLGEGDNVSIRRMTAEAIGTISFPSFFIKI